MMCFCDTEVEMECVRMYEQNSSALMTLGIVIEEIKKFNFNPKMLEPGVRPAPQNPIFVRWEVLVATKK